MRYEEPLLEPGEDLRLVRTMEAGVLADACLRDDDWRPLAGDATDDELRELRRAGEEARERLVLANLRLVHAVAGELARRWGLPFEELFSEGVVGLLDALPRFDERREMTFGRFAAVCIRHRMLGAVSTRCGELHVTRGQAAAARARGLEVQAPAGLGAVGEDPVARAERPDEQAATARLLALLSPLEREVVRRRFGLDGPARSQREVARDLGVGRHTARQLEASALARLRAHADLDVELLAA